MTFKEGSSEHDPLPAATVVRALLGPPQTSSPSGPGQAAALPLPAALRLASLCHAVPEGAVCPGQLRLPATRASSAPAPQTPDWRGALLHPCFLNTVCVLTPGAGTAACWARTRTASTTITPRSRTTGPVLTPVLPAAAGTLPHHPTRNSRAPFTTFHVQVHVKGTASLNHHPELGPAFKAGRLPTPRPAPRSPARLLLSAAPSPAPPPPTPRLSPALLSVFSVQALHPPDFYRCASPSALNPQPPR